MTALAGYICFGGNDEAALPSCEAMLRSQGRYANTPPKVIGGDGFAVGLAAYRLGRARTRVNPVTSDDGRFALVADIRIFNRIGWIERVGIAADQAAILSDSEILLTAWQRQGAKCLDHLNADFAMALWDGDRRELVLARDFLGQRPLFFTRGDGWVACASMPSGLFALPEVPCVPDHEMTAGYIGLSVPTGNRWYFDRVSRVVPGTVLRISADDQQETAHWPPRRRTLTLKTPADYVDALREGLDRAVAARIGPGDVVGCHLSAGLDSAAVMASAAGRLQSGALLHAYTAAPPEGFDSPAIRGRFPDEGPLAAASAAMYPNVVHRILASDSADPTLRWDQVFHLFQAPVPNPCNWTWGADINDAARADGVTVMLAGQVGNLGFSYQARAHHANLLARGALMSLLRAYATGRRAGRSWAALVRETFGPFLPIALLRQRARFLGRPTTFADLHFGTDQCAGPGDDYLVARPMRDSWAERVNALSMLDFGVYNKGILAGWGIDMRDPTTDRDLFELCLSLPDEAFLHQGRPRGLALAALADRLPTRVLAEKRRGYQAADWRKALWNGRDALADEIRRSRNSAQASDLIDQSAVERALADLSDDLSPGQSDELRLRRGLLRAASAAHFIRKATGRND